MTTIDINDQAQMIRVKGHSGYAEAGKDIVCAGISALTWTLAGALHKLGALTFVEEKDGDVLLCYKAFPEALPYVDMFNTGAEMLEYKYPENVKVQGRKTGNENDTMK
jgi:hypothetical protein